MDSQGAGLMGGPAGHRRPADEVRRVFLVATTTSLLTLGILVGLVELPATWSNVIATAVGTVPSFELNRRWVWNSTSRRSLSGQVVPFCALSFTGLVVSTLAVGMTASRTEGWSHWSHTVAVLSANVAAYGALWVVQYRMLDRLLFRSRPGVRGPWPAPDAQAPDRGGPAASGMIRSRVRAEPGRATGNIDAVSLAPCGTNWGDGLTRWASAGQWPRAGIGSSACSGVITATGSSGKIGETTIT